MYTLLGEYLGAASQPLPSRTKLHLPQPAVPHFSELVKDHVAAKVAAGAWSAETAKINLESLERFQHFAGDPFITDIKSGMVLDYRTHLQASRGPTGKLLTPSTINHHLGYLGTALKHAKLAGWLTQLPTDGMKLPKNKASLDARLPFVPEEITKIFGAAFFEATEPLSAKRWLPLIMAYSGARNEEVAQLRIQDLRTQSGVWIFDLETLEEGLRRKTASSRRLVPVHPQLLSGGILELLEQNVSRQLFPELNRSSRGKLSETPSRWFNETWLRAECGISDPRKVLYSLRHAVSASLREHDLPTYRIGEILGHSDDSVSTGTYGAKTTLLRIQESISLLDWAVSWPSGN